MPCDTRLKKNQTIQQRAEEVRRVVGVVAAGLAAGRIKAKVGPQGGITFVGLSDQERDGITDNCCYRRLLTSGSASALMAIQRAEALAGRSVDKQAVARGVHSHDGGVTYHDHKG